MPHSGGNVLNYSLILLHCILTIIVTSNEHIGFELVWYRVQKFFSEKNPSKFSAIWEFRIQKSMRCDPSME